MYTKTWKTSSQAPEWQRLLGRGPADTREVWKHGVIQEFQVKQCLLGKDTRGWKAGSRFKGSGDKHPVSDKAGRISEKSLRLQHSKWVGGSLGRTSVCGQHGYAGYAVLNFREHCVNVHTLHLIVHNPGNVISTPHLCQRSSFRDLVLRL